MSRRKHTVTCHHQPPTPNIPLPAPTPPIQAFYTAFITRVQQWITARGGPIIIILPSTFIPYHCTMLLRTGEKGYMTSTCMLGMFVWVIKGGNNHNSTFHHLIGGASMPQTYPTEGLRRWVVGISSCTWFLHCLRRINKQPHDGGGCLFSGIWRSQ